MFTQKKFSHKEMFTSNFPDHPGQPERQTGRDHLRGPKRSFPDVSRHDRPGGPASPRQSCDPPAGGESRCHGESRQNEAQRQGRAGGL